MKNRIEITSGEIFLWALSVVASFMLLGFGLAWLDSWILIERKIAIFLTTITPMTWFATCCKIILAVVKKRLES
jgi:hypothetical protein